MPQNILELSVNELVDAYRQGTYTPLHAVEACIAQIKEQNPSLNAFCFIEDEDILRAQAHESAKRWAENCPIGPYDGVPISIKDGTDVQGWVTRDGSAATADGPAESDSPAVANLRAAGCIFLGKTTLPEFGLKGVTHGPLYGVTRNPWNVEKTTGGSSGGAAAAAAAGMGYMHLGSDGGGSLRIPACFCGVTGYKPTQGLIKEKSISPFSPMATTGAIARTVEDAEIMFNIMAPDAAEKTSALPNKALRIAYAPTLNDFAVDPEIAAQIEICAQHMEALGTVEKSDLHIPDLIDTFTVHWAAIAAWIYDQIPADRRTLMDPYVVEWAKQGEALSLYDYMNAQVIAAKIKKQIQEIFDSYDIILMPTMAMSPFAAERNEPEGLKGAEWTPFTFAANLAQLPAASIPCGVTADKLPMGAQLIAYTNNDSYVLKAAKFLEQKIKFEDWLLKQNKDDMRASNAA